MDTRLFEVVANYTYDWESWFLPDGTVHWINPAVERMTGFTIEECFAMDDYPLGMVHPEDRQAVESLLSAAIDGTSGNDVEFRISRKDGRLGWAAVSWQPMVGADGEPLGVRTSVRDISWRKNTEEALRVAKADAERAHTAKSRILAAVSHDLRQPLQAIGMYVAALGLRPLDNTGHALVTDIRKCLDASSELLDYLADISRLDAGVVVPELSDVPVTDLFELLEKNFRSDADEREIDLRFVPRSLFVRADPVILGRILQNLVSNALRYTEKGRVLVGCRRRNGAAVLEVWDTGVGIAAEEQGRIFEEFYQVNNAARDRRRGVGLGLAIVHRLSELLNAQVAMRSERGKGSMFSITLPLAQGHDAKVSPTRQDYELDLDSRTIAVIDDEPLQLEALQSFLGLCNAEIVAAQSIDELLIKVDGAGASPELIVADYRLEGGATGAEAVAALRFKMGQPIPGILITGDTDPKRIAEAEASGCRLLHKPVDASSLAQTINDVLKRR